MIKCLDSKGSTINRELNKFIKNTESINGYYPSYEEYERLYSIHYLIQSCHEQNTMLSFTIHSKDLNEIKNLVQNLKRESFSQILIMDQPILYDLLSNDHIFSTIAPILEEKDVKMDFINDFSGNTLLMNCCAKYIQYPAKITKNVDFLLNHGADLHHINQNNLNIMNYLPNPWHDSVRNPFIIVDLYQTLKQHNNGQDIVPTNWGDFVFNIYTSYSQKTINNLEKEMGINFLDQVNDFIKYTIVYESINYCVKYNDWVLDETKENKKKTKYSML